MREHKYRAWHKAEKRMFRVEHLSWHFGIFLIGDKNAFDGRRFGSGEVELMQFTGLTDRNGTDIYEGDIIRYLDNTGYGLVEKTVYIEDIRALPDFICSKWEEVIGNIYENPELLKEEPK